MNALRADCANCFGLCCVASAFTRSADFALDKPAGMQCPNLLEDFRCGVHGVLRTKGFAGCSVFDCLGAGQKVAQVTYHGRGWRDAPETATEMFSVYNVMRQLHEILWYLGEASATELFAEVEKLTEAAAEIILGVDVDALRDRVRPVLTRFSEERRAGIAGRQDRRGADLIGARLRKAALRGADLRGAYLLGADLREADLRRADLLGADLRNADIRGADLRDALFLTQFQLNAARGDARTGFSDALTRPAHWE
jgi:pentapeptide repeat protein